MRIGISLVASLGLRFSSKEPGWLPTVGPRTVERWTWDEMTTGGGGEYVAIPGAIMHSEE